MATFFDLIFYALIEFWWIFLLFGLFIFVFIQAAMRQIVNVVCYVRGGKTWEMKRCLVFGTNIKFRPNKGAPPVTVPILSQPYLWNRGISMRRIYVVVEGSGQTSRFTDDSWTLDQQSGKRFKNVEAGSALNPSLMSASSSLSYFERFVTHISTNLPKGKTDFIMIVIYVALGFVGGIAWGKILIK